MLTSVTQTNVKSDTLDCLYDTISHIAVGTGTTDPTVSDTALESEVLRKARQEATKNIGSGTVTVSMWIASTEANGNTLSEVGTFDSASGGNMFSRDTFTGLNKTSSIEVWIDIEFQVDVAINS